VFGWDLAKPSPGVKSHQGRERRQKSGAVQLNGLPCKTPHQPHFHCCMRWTGLPVVDQVNSMARLHRTTSLRRTARAPGFLS
jgi:hypothetical protein